MDRTEGEAVDNGQDGLSDVEAGNESGEDDNDDNDNDTDEEIDTKGKGECIIGIASGEL